MGAFLHLFRVKQCKAMHFDVTLTVTLTLNLTLILTLTLTLTLTLFKMHRFTFRSVYDKKSQKYVLWDTIHRSITFVRMSTIWRDTGLESHIVFFVSSAST